MQNFEEFKKAQEEIEKIISQLATNEKKPILDGPVNMEEYFESKIKILWLLKEPYDNANKGAGNWSLAELLNAKDVYSKFLSKTSSKRTWYPIIYASWGILNSTYLYDEMDFIDDQPAMTSVLRKIAFININKLAGNSTSNMGDIRRKYLENKSILLKQTQTYNPTVIIGGRTLQIYSDLFDLPSKRMEISQAGTKYYLDNTAIYVDAYHPGRIGIPRYRSVNEEYIDDLLQIYQTASS